MGERGRDRGLDALFPHPGERDEAGPELLLRSDRVAREHLDPTGCLRDATEDEAAPRRGLAGASEQEVLWTAVVAMGLVFAVRAIIAAVSKM